ncbi:MAG: hypothetical protein PHY93_20835, partial [Bacteriovorax sp.]|nr:hypothetical protein [Bacteriovorax sp.]
MSSIAFLPWVSISNEFVINGVKFKPIKITECDLPVEVLQKIIGMTKPYSLSPIYESSIKEFTIVYYEELGVLHELDEEKRNNLFMIMELVKLTALGQREYFTHGPYFNANNFQLIIQGFVGTDFGVAITCSRRDGSVTAYTPAGQFKQFAPNNINKLINFNIDQEFIRSLYRAYIDDSEKWE